MCVFVSTQWRWWVSPRSNRTYSTLSPVCCTSATSTSLRGTTTQRSPTSSVSPHSLTLFFLRRILVAFAIYKALGAGLGSPLVHSWYQKSKHIFLSFCHNARDWQTDRRTDRILIVMQMRYCSIVELAPLGRRSAVLHRIQNLRRNVGAVTWLSCLDQSKSTPWSAPTRRLECPI